MIDWLPYEIWGWGQERAKVLTVAFLGTGQG